MKTIQECFNILTSLQAVSLHFQSTCKFHPGIDLPKNIEYYSIIGYNNDGLKNFLDYLGNQPMEKIEKLSISFSKSIIWIQEFQTLNKFFLKKKTFRKLELNQVSFLSPYLIRTLSTLSFNTLTVKITSLQSPTCKDSDQCQQFIELFNLENINKLKISVLERKQVYEIIETFISKKPNYETKVILKESNLTYLRSDLIISISS